MRLLVIALLLAFVVLVLLRLPGLGLGARGRATVPAKDRASARWSAAHVGTGGSTLIEVRLVTRKGRVLEARRVASVPDVDPDYEARLLEAMAQARSRATVLNLELGG